MPRPMPSMFTTLTEKIDTSPSERGADEHGERRDDAAERDEQRHAGGDEPAEQEHHDDDGDRQRDRLAPQQVVLRRGGERLADQHVAADEHLGRVELVGEVLDLVGERQLGVLVEVAGQRDDDERGASVGGPQGVEPVSTRDRRRRARRRARRSARARR